MPQFSHASAARSSTKRHCVQRRDYPRKNGDYQQPRKHVFESQAARFCVGICARFHTLKIGKNLIALKRGRGDIEASDEN